MEIFNLNLVPGQSRPVCHVSQFDKGRTIKVNLYDGASAYTLSGETVSVSVRKPDGNVVTAGATLGDTYVMFETTEQMTAVEGSNICELKITSGSDVIGTANFIMDVEEDPLNNGIQSDSAIYNLSVQVSNLVAAEVANQYDSANVIFDASPTAGHGTGYAVTSEGVKTAIDAIPPEVEIKTASGSVVSFTDGSELPYNSVITEIVAEQESGTPTPAGPKAITGFSSINIEHSGKNLVKYPYSDTTKTQNGITFTDNGDGSITISGVASDTAFFDMVSRNNLAFLNAGTYTRSAIYGNSEIQFRIYKNDETAISSGNEESNFSLTETTYIFYFILVQNGADFSTPVTVYPQIELGSTATEYEAFTGTTTTVSLGQTVYGGELNITTGELTITHALLEKTVASMNNYEEYPGWKEAGVRDFFGGGVDAVLRNSILNIGSTIGVNTMGNLPVNRDVLFLPTEAYGLTQTEWQENYPDLTIQIMLEYPTPITVQLTATQIDCLLGNNTIYSNSGDVSVSYYGSNSGSVVQLVEDVIKVTNELATVARTGDYSDLANTPSLATVATSGAYSDLTGTPDLSITDISASFTLNSAGIADLTGNVNAYLQNGRVRVYLRATSAGNTLDTSTAFYTVASAYRPAAKVTFPAMILVNGAWQAYNGDLGTDGKITQAASSSASGIYACFEYSI